MESSENPFLTIQPELIIICSYYHSYEGVYISTFLRSNVFSKISLNLFIWLLDV